MLMTSIGIEQFDTRFLFAGWNDEWKETTAIRSSYCLARRIQVLYNDFVDARDTGTVSPWEVYGIHLLMENLMFEFARATANRDEIWKYAITEHCEKTPKILSTFSSRISTNYAMLIQWKSTKNSLRNMAKIL